MSLTLVWTDDATPVSDHQLHKVVKDVLEQGLETLQVGQSALVDAFRLAVVEDRIEHSAITLDVQGTIYTFNQFGNFVNYDRWPIPDVPGRIVAEILGGQIARKKRAEKAAQVAAQAVD